MFINQILTKLKSLVYSKSETDSLLNGKASSSHTHTKSQITDFPSLATVATSGSYSDLSNKPSSMTPSSHSHGNITNAGAIGTTANKPLITTTNGAITTGSFGTTANTFCQGNDSRLSDARTPTSHTHVKSEITDFPTIPSKTSQLTNDSGFLTSHQSLSNYSTLANTVKSLSISGKTITVTPGSGNAYTLTTQDTNTTYSNFVKSGSGAAAGLVPAPSTTAGTTKYLREDGTWQVPPDHTYTVNNATLTIQKNGTTVKTFTANASSNVTCNITVPTNTNQLTNGNGFISSEIDSSGSGWVRFKSGIQICWGRTTNNNGLAAGIMRIVFAKAFNAKPNVVATPDISDGYLCTALVEGTTTWVLNSYLYNGGIVHTSNGVTSNWVAIGTWK